MPNESELKHALEVIRDECRSHKGCEDCPLVVDDAAYHWHCQLFHYSSPMKWNPKEMILEVDDG